MGVNESNCCILLFSNLLKNLSSLIGGIGNSTQIIWGEVRKVEAWKRSQTWHWSNSLWSQRAGETVQECLPWIQGWTVSFRYLVWHWKLIFISLFSEKSLHWLIKNP